eukprot:TRINITY_DN34075_c0_g1_i1.p2 TRINITY_DN34075_c0_g1~~TRINITY_DN34075_c0_g1_i1.p2  ORF type:complete len:112 (+),score=1.53 TRINITY_DN34075_c0_g1_i1:56-391(+)
MLFSCLRRDVSGQRNVSMGHGNGAHARGCFYNGRKGQSRTTVMSRSKSSALHPLPEDAACQDQPGIPLVRRKRSRYGVRASWRASLISTGCLRHLQWIRARPAAGSVSTRD